MEYLFISVRKLQNIKFKINFNLNKFIYFKKFGDLEKKIILQTDYYPLHFQINGIIYEL